MGELRSSWEIAQEKAGRLGDLSAEERKQHRESEYRGAAFVAVKEYLNSRNSRFLEKEMNRYKGDDNELMRRMMLDCLINSIGLHDESKLEPVLKGIAVLYENARGDDLLDRINKLYSEHRNSFMEEKNCMEDSGREKLRQKGISGSAIAIVCTDSSQLSSSAPGEANERFHKELVLLTKPFRE